MQTIVLPYCRRRIMGCYHNGVTLKVLSFAGKECGVHTAGLDLQQFNLHDAPWDEADRHRHL